MQSLLGSARALLHFTAIALLLASSAGCATIVKGSHQKVPIASELPGADVLVDGSMVGQTPLNLEMKRKNDHLVTIQMAGFRPKSVAVVKDVGGAVWGNIIAGGLIGWGVMHRPAAQYNLTPKTISVTLEPASAVMVTESNVDPSIFVSKLKALDDMKANGQVSDEEFGKARLELFRKFMPEALPDDARQATASK